ncbi:MAG TPA: glycogen debranching protein GlgX [Planctomycetaceae bacterium]|nr:glycogen debranching protein GlgX [Planctomycetaceae bacterium]
MRVWPGKHYPLGATWDGNGVNFALFSECATGVELCLFDSPDDTTEALRIPLVERRDNVWHCYLPDVRPGQLYGYRVDGPYDPANGHRFNRNKIVLDPYAKGIGRNVRWCDEVWGYTIGNPEGDLSFDERDSAHAAPLAVVIDPAFTWGDDRNPRRPWHETIIYEVHVKGFTKLHPDVPEELRGTYAGLSSPAAIAHLKSIGVTAVELLPVQQRCDDRHLIDKGLCNYWGYNTLGFFAPDQNYSAAQSADETVKEFKTMVRGLHAAGIEVLLDVVYNHTAEGNQCGPTLTFRGVDNASYYRLSPENPRYYMDFTGCGNGFNMRSPRVLQLIMDSLRYWVTEMHVDGFRFDLASALARELFEVDKLGAFFDILHQDPVLAQVKLIAEPWDLGSGGYQVGNFPSQWSEWNGRYRDNVRRFWKGDGGDTLSEFATRLCGSADLYQWSGRSPSASINFITCHDGFNLHDLVSYNQKHNEANGENNRDGADHNESWNCGVEGPTDDPEINTLRERQKRNMLATLFMSQGVPMLLAGDELGKTQRGNNNCYCQDNEITWLEWNLNESQQQMLQFVRGIVALRKTQPVFCRQKFFQGRSIRSSERVIADVGWIGADGNEVSDDVWNAGFVKCIGLRLDGELIGEVNEQGEPICGDTVLLLLNAHHEEVLFTLPVPVTDAFWEPLMDTAQFPGQLSETKGGTQYRILPRSMALLRLTTPAKEEQQKEGFVSREVLAEAHMDGDVEKLVEA